MLRIARGAVIRKKSKMTDTSTAFDQNALEYDNWRELKLELEQGVLQNH